jgi:EpsI family protein
VCVIKSQLRFASAVILLVGATIFLYARGSQELVPARESFVSFPQQLGEWQGTDVPISKETLDVLGAGDFLYRDYQRAASDPSRVGLFLAYFASQRTGDTIHSPKHCLPGSGWMPVQSSQIPITLPGRTPFTANRYLIQKGDQRGLVIYYYWAHNRAVASEYWAKYYLIRDSIALNRSDGSLIRVTTVLVPGETVEAAQVRLLDLLQNATPFIDRYIPI